MNRTWLALGAAIWSSVAAAETSSACLFTPAELRVPLGHTPTAGVSSKNAQGQAGCQYGMEDAKGVHFWVRIDEKCDRKAFDRQARTRQSISGKTNVTIAGLGDGAYYSPGGTAAVRVGARCVELSGLRAGAKRVVTAADAEQLLRLAVSHLGK